MFSLSPNQWQNLSLCFGRRQGSQHSWELINTEFWLFCKIKIVHIRAHQLAWDDETKDALCNLSCSSPFQITKFLVDQIFIYKYYISKYTKNLSSVCGILP